MHFLPFANPVDFPLITHPPKNDLKIIIIKINNCLMCDRFLNFSCKKKKRKKKSFHTPFPTLLQQQHHHRIFIQMTAMTVLFCFGSKGPAIPHFFRVSPLLFHTQLIKIKNKKRNEKCDHWKNIEKNDTNHTVFKDEHSKDTRTINENKIQNQLNTRNWK